MTRSSSEPQQAEEALKELHQAWAGLYGPRLKKASLFGGWSGTRRW